MKFLKRFFDLLFSGLLLLVFSPLLLVITLAAWLTSGRPVFFRQSRLGRGGRPFQIIKFRTMIVNAPDLRNPDGSTYNADDDPRLTPIGRFLRRTSLDELPQLFNVFVGEMSLVGPRPDQVDQLAHYTPQEKRKLEVKPGITGLAQISGRNAISWGERKLLDLEYVDNWSNALDLKILLKTIPYVLLSRDVYIDPQQESGDNRNENSLHR